MKHMRATLAPTTIDTRFTIVRGVFRAAVADRLIASDPTVGVVLPRKRKAEAAMTIPTNADVARLLHAAEPASRPTSRPGFTAYVALCAFAGLRRGEALGVQVADIDFLARTLRVTRQLQRAKPADVAAGKNLVEAVGGITVIVRAPKYESERTIYLPDELVAILSEHVRQHTPEGEPSRWLFDEDGRPWHDNLVDYRWRSTRTDAGVDTSCTSSGTTSPAASSPPDATSSPCNGRWDTRLPRRPSTPTPTSGRPRKTRPERRRGDGGGRSCHASATHRRALGL